MAATLTPQKEQPIRPFFEEIFAGDPFATLTSVRRAMNSLFDSAFVPTMWYAPPMDVYNHDGIYTVEAVLPGIDKKDVDIEVDGNRLTVSGKYSRETTEAERVRRYQSRELQRGNFSRSVTFPEDIDVAKVVATFEKGILKIEVPSLYASEPKKVAIK